MSVTAMAHVWADESLGSTDKLVLLSLADHADEEGSCYPSVGRISRRTGLGERAVQNSLKRLKEEGRISVKMNGGKRGSNRFFLHPTPAPDAPRTKCTPAPDAPLPPHEVHPTPARGAPEPSRTVSEPSVEDSAPAKKARLPENWTPSDEDREYARSLKLHEDEITEIADDFCAYWNDRTDKGGRKSERGWRQTWRNRCRDQAPRFLRNRQMALRSIPGDGGRGGGIAGEVARRRLGG